MTTFWTVAAAVLIFCILIFVHELGHFLAAKLFKVRVHEFAIGMGPKLLKKRWGETLYSVRLFPIGGFCALEGEDTASEDEGSLSKKKPWVKLIVTAAGPCMNMLLGFLLLFCLFGSADYVNVPQVKSVETGSPAQMAGIRPGDTFVSFNDRHVFTVNDLYWEIPALSEKSVTVEVKRAGEKETVTFEPLEKTEEPFLGITLETQKNSFFLTLKNGFFTTGFYGRVVLDTFIDLLRGRIGINMMSGPIGIVSEIGTAVEQVAENGREGFRSLLQLTILLTVNLGIFNLMPIPALDGGRIFFILVEFVRRKPIPPEKEGIVHLVGFALLILLSLVVAYQDVLRLLV